MPIKHLYLIILEGVLKYILNWTRTLRLTFDGVLSILMHYRWTMYLIIVVSQGFEPQLTEPKSAVLPLYYETIKPNKWVLILAVDECVSSFRWLTPYNIYLMHLFHCSSKIQLTNNLFDFVVPLGLEPRTPWLWVRCY